MFGKLKELLNPILIVVDNAWWIYPTSIHVFPLLSNFIKLSDMHENLTFSLEVWPYPIQEDIFYNRFIRKG